MSDAQATKSDRTTQLGTKSIASLLLRFSVPAIVGMMVQSLYNVVDRIFIGNGVGPLGLAGATVSFPFMLVIMAFGMLIGIGGGSLLSISLGEGKKDFAESVINNAFVLIIIISSSLMVCGLVFLDPLLRLTGASEAVLPYARSYMRIILLGVMLNNIGFSMNNFIRAEGNPKIAMMTMLIGAILNTILDPIFIFIFDMGIAGAAWATIISQAMSAIWVLSYFLSGKSHLTIDFKRMRLRKDVVLRIVAIGSAPFAMQIAASALNTILNNQLKTYGGDMAISAMGIIYSVAMLILMPIFGLNQGSQPIIGYNYGAKQYKRVIRSVELTMMVATFIVATGWLATRLFPQFIISAFSRGNIELVDIGTRAMRIFFFMFPFVGFQVVGASYFQAVGKPKHAMFLSLSRQVLLLIPLLLILPRFFGLDGVYGASPTADFLSSILTGIFFFLELRSLKKMPAVITAPIPD
ncbi:MAG: MATE family efflux transporter [Spirochaetia bacterium]|jgi:putative MATE family efflux protein|nr:MATE family efflux transporter [Spirochaetia bacterium]